MAREMQRGMLPTSSCFGAASVAADIYLKSLIQSWQIGSNVLVFCEEMGWGKELWLADE